MSHVLGHLGDFSYEDYQHLFRKNFRPVHVRAARWSSTADTVLNGTETGEQNVRAASLDPPIQPKPNRRSRTGSHRQSEDWTIASLLTLSVPCLNSRALCRATQGTLGHDQNHPPDPRRPRVEQGTWGWDSSYHEGKSEPGRQLRHAYLSGRLPSRVRDFRRF